MVDEDLPLIDLNSSWGGKLKDKLSRDSLLLNTYEYWWQALIVDIIYVESAQFEYIPQLLEYILLDNR